MNLDKKDSDFLKGWSIILIVLHNLLHNIKPLPSQNEFHFKIKKSSGLFNIFMENQSDIYRAMISFYGHYGVKIFIFLSAYGLMKCYLNKELIYKKYLVHHAGKLYKAMIVAVIFWFIFELVVNQKSYEVLINNNWYAVVLKFLAVNIRGYALEPVGPWWFFAAIIQLYLLFPLLLVVLKKHGSLFLLLLSIFAYAVLILSERKILLYNSVGHLPEFCLGMYLASKQSFQVNKLVILLATAVFVLGHFYQFFWYFSGTSIILITLYAYGFLDTNKGSNNVIGIIGSLSLYIFLINGFLRKPFIPWLKGIDSDLVIFLFSMVFLAGVIILAKILSWATKKPFHF